MCQCCVDIAACVGLEGSCPQDQSSGRIRVQGLGFRVSWIHAMGFDLVGAARSQTATVGQTLQTSIFCALMQSVTHPASAEP